MKLTFIGIGAQKCASSWLYDILADHPEAALSNKKELDFFSYNYERGYQWYEGQFLAKPNARICGEISPSYLNEASVPARVRLYAPDTRILLMLRNPVQRALSQHRHLVRIGYVPGPDFSFEAGLKNNPSYIEQGQYATHLQRWFDAFSREQILVVLMDDLRYAPDKTAKSVYRFLGVSTEHTSSALHEKSNPSYVVRSRLTDNLITGLRQNAKKIGLQAAWKAMGDSGLRKLYRVANRQPSEALIPPAKEETLVELRAIFHDEILRLESMLNRDLQGWLAP